MPYEYFMDTIQDSHFIQSKTDRLCRDMGKTDHIGVFLIWGITVVLVIKNQLFMFLDFSVVLYTVC